MVLVVLALGVQWRSAASRSVGTGPDSRVRVRGVLSDGRAVDYAPSREPELGQLVARADGEWWVKGRLPSGEFLLSRGKGYRVENRCEKSM